MYRFALQTFINPCTDLSKKLARSANFLQQRYGERDNPMRFDVAIGSV